MLALVNPEKFSGEVPIEAIDGAYIDMVFEGITTGPVPIGEKRHQLKLHEAESMRIATAQLLGSDDLTADLERYPAFKELLDRDIFLAERSPDLLTSSEASMSVIRHDQRVKEAITAHIKSQKERQPKSVQDDLEDKAILSMWNSFFESWSVIRPRGRSSAA